MMPLIQKTNKKILFVISFLLLGVVNANAQVAENDSIPKKKHINVYVHKTCERMIAKGHESIEMFEYLGDYFYKNNELDKSKKYLDLLFMKYKASQISAQSFEIYKKLQLRIKT